PGYVLGRSLVFVSRAVEQVPRLPAGIGAEYSQVEGGVQPFMSCAGGQHHNIARMHVRGEASVTAELDPGTPAIYNQNFVRRAVIMVIRINPVPPARTPAIGFQQSFNGTRCIARRKLERAP